MNASNSTAASKHIVGLFTELVGVGGVQEAGRLTAAALTRIAERRGWTTDFFGLNDPPREETFQTCGRDIRVRGFARKKLKFAAFAIRAALVDEPTTVLAAHPNLAPLAAGTKALAPSIQTIVMSHGLDVWQPLPPLRRRSLHRADVALAPSRDTAEKLTNIQRVAPQKVRILPWPLSPGFLELAARPDTLPLPRSLPSDPSGRVILTVGRWAALERYKGVDELIQAVAKLRPAFPGLHLVAVGGGDDLPRLRALASAAGIADRTHFLENLRREEVAACYARAEIFALPSAGEGFGMVFLEAMAFGKPVVGASYGGTLDLVQEGVNGLLVPPRDADSLARALARLLEGDAFRRQLGTRGAEILRQKYSFEAFESALECILRQR